MGQAKQRGTFEERVAEAMIRVAEENLAKVERRRLLWIEMDRLDEAKRQSDIAMRERIGALPQEERLSALNSHRRLRKSLSSNAALMGLALAAAMMTPVFPTNRGVSFPE